MQLTLQQARINKGLTVSEVSARSGVSKTVIKRYEVNNYRSLIITIYKLLAVYQLGIDHLKIDTRK